MRNEIRVFGSKNEYRYCILQGLFSHRIFLRLGRGSDASWTIFSDRLYSKGRILGFKRAKRNSSPNTSLLQIEGVSNKEEAQFYLGKVLWLCIH